MKNLFSNLAAFCSGLLICIAVIACANDADDNSDNTIALLSQQILELNKRVQTLEKKTELPNLINLTDINKSHDDKFTYEYDNSGRISKISYKSTSTYNDYHPSAKAVITYNGNTCTIEYEDSDGLKDYSTTYKFTFDAQEIKDCKAINYLIISFIKCRLY